MHTTIVTLKSGEVYKGAIYYFRPCFNWFTLFGYERKFYFDDCLSVITPNERVSINSPLEGEICDEMKRAKQILDDGRKYGWTETNEDGIREKYSEEKWAWESKYE